MEYTEPLAPFDDVKLRYPRDRVGILGGTFNPIHNGHIDMAYNIRNEFELKTVVLMPTGNPPHKLEHPGLAHAEQRLRMVSLAVCESPGLQVSNVEVRREGMTYTVETMRELTARYDNSEFYFIIGSDSLFELESWYGFSELCRLTKFVCVGRHDHDGLMIAAEVVRLRELYGAEIRISSYRGLQVSSSYIRKLVQRGKPISEFVPALVEEYIIASGLYK